MRTKNFYLQSVVGQEHVGFGFGETDRTYEERQNDSDYSKSHSSNLLFLGSKWETYGWWENQTVIDRDNGQDKEVHSFLNSTPGIKQLTDPDTGRKLEVFHFTKKGFGKHLTLDIVKDMIHNRFFSQENTEKKNIIERRHQREFIVKSTWQEWKEFLLFAKCRAGKTVMTLGLIKERGYKVTLVVSRVTSVIDGWKNDVNTFKEFDNFVFIQYSKNWTDEIQYWMNTDKQIILFDTVQGAHKRKLQNLNIEFLVYDEAHIGSSDSCGQWKSLRSKVDCPVLFVTGTAYKMVDDFTDNNSFIYSYFEEQLDKKKGLNNRPSFDLVLVDYDVDFKNVFGDEADSLNNLFRVTNGEFNDPEIVQEFVSRYFEGDKRIRHNNRLLNKTKHMYITLPSVDACYSFAKLLEGTRFTPLVVTGDANQDPAAINKHLEENPTGAAIITRTANVLGVTAKTIDTVINLSQGESIEFWNQFAFRGGSGDRSWRVIDFVPDRCLSSLRQMFVLATENNPELLEYEFTDFVDILEWSNGETELDESAVYQLMAKEPRDIKRFLTSVTHGLNMNILEDLDFTPSLESSDDCVVIEREINEQGTDKSSNKRRTTITERSEISDHTKLRDHVNSIMERLPIFMIHLLSKDESVNNLLSLTDHPFYESATFDYDRVLSRYCEQDPGFFRKLNHRINEFVVDLKVSYANDPIKTLEDLSVSDSKSKTIPSNLFASICPRPQSDDQNLIIICDPVGLHSLMAHTLGWKYDQITVFDDSSRHHFSIQSISDKITVSKDFLNSDMTYNPNRIIIGNPPYGNGGNDAIKFLNKSSEKAPTIIMVLPLSVRKVSAVNKISPNIVCVEDDRLPDDTFPKGIHTVRQKWVKTDTPRTKIEVMTKHPDFEFVNRKDPESDVFVMRVGYAGKVMTEDYEKYRDSSTGHFFLKVKDQKVIDTLKECEPEFREVASETNGLNVLSKDELIRIYSKHVRTNSSALDQLF